MRVLLAFLSLLLAGCLSAPVPPLADVPAPLALPSAGSAFTHLLCGELLIPLADRAGEVCNVRVTHDSGPAAEVFLVASPLDPLLLVGGSKDFSLGEESRCGVYSVWSGVYRSTDGGRSWSHSLLPGYPGDSRQNALSEYPCGSDPVLAFGPDGTLYYTSLLFEVGPERPPHPMLGPVWGGGYDRSALAVTASSDGGLTWDEPSIVATRTGPILDKQWLAVDPASGAVYLSYIDTGPGAFFVQRSDDRGRTWSEPVEVVRGEDGLAALVEGPYLVQFGQVGVAPGGRVHFIHFALRDREERGAILHWSSDDLGVSWEGPTRVAVMDFTFDLGFRQKYRVVGMPAIAVDGASGTVHVVYPSRNPVDLDILHVASTDGGASWAAPVRVNDGLAVEPSNDQWMPAAVVGPDGTVHATWIDYREDPRGTWGRIRYAHSSDGGATWAPSASLSDAPFDGTGGYHQSGSGTIGDYMGLAVSPLAVHAFWADTREGRNDVWSALIPAR